jgi:hypothetical protein
MSKSFVAKAILPVPAVLSHTGEAVKRGTKHEFVREYWRNGETHMVTPDGKETPALFWARVKTEPVVKAEVEGINAISRARAVSVAIAGLVAKALAAQPHRLVRTVRFRTSGRIAPITFTRVKDGSVLVKTRGLPPIRVYSVSAHPESKPRFAAIVQGQRFYAQAEKLAYRQAVEFAWGV